MATNHTNSTNNINPQNADLLPLNLPSLSATFTTPNSTIITPSLLSQPRTPPNSPLPPPKRSKPNTQSGTKPPITKGFSVSAATIQSTITLELSRRNLSYSYDSNGHLNIKCSCCHKPHDVYNDPHYPTPYLLQYILKYVCPTCTKANHHHYQHHTGNTRKFIAMDWSTSFICLSKTQCHSNITHLFNGLKGFDNWSKHYSKHHSANLDPHFLQLTNQRRCDNSTCPNLISTKCNAVLCGMCSSIYTNNTSISYQKRSTEPPPSLTTQTTSGLPTHQTPHPTTSQTTPLGPTIIPTPQPCSFDSQPVPPQQTNLNDPNNPSIINSDTQDFLQSQSQTNSYTNHINHITDIRGNKTVHFKDSAGQSYSYLDILKVYRYHKQPLTAKLQDELSKHFSRNLAILSKSFRNLKNAMDATMGIVLLWPTWFIQTVSVTDKVQINKKRKERIKLYKQRQWAQLIKLLNIEYTINLKNCAGIPPPTKPVSQSDLPTLPFTTVTAANGVQFQSLIPPDLLNTQHAPSAGPINTNLLHKYHSSIQAFPDESVKSTKSRLQRVLFNVESNKFRKANNLLKGSKFFNLHKPGGFDKLLSKYPTKPPLTFTAQPSRFHMKYEDLVSVISGMNPEGGAGPYGLDNKFIIDLVKRDTVYQFIDHFKPFISAIYSNQLCPELRDIFLYTTGLAFSKTDKDDVRPVTVCDVLIRTADRVIRKSISPTSYRALIGPYQCIGLSAGTGKATLAAESMSNILHKSNKFCILNDDVTNAYNAYDRDKAYSLLKAKLPEIANYFYFLYGQPNIIQYTHKHIVQMSVGGFQGVSTTELFYSAVKWDVHQRTQQIASPKQVSLHAQTDFIDDGLKLGQHHNMDKYLDILIDQYRQYNLQLNKKKTTIIFNIPSTDTTLTQELQQRYAEYDLVFDNNFTFLNIPHGTSEFHDAFMHNRITDIEKKLLNVMCINSNQARFLLLQKFLNYNKVIYHLSHNQYNSKSAWYQRVLHINKFISKLILVHIKPTNDQLLTQSLKQRNGGLGVQSVFPYNIISQYQNLKHSLPYLPTFYGFTDIPSVQALIAKHDSLNPDNDSDIDIDDVKADPPPPDPSPPSAHPVQAEPTRDKYYVKHNYLNPLDPQTGFSMSALTVLTNLLDNDTFFNGRLTQLQDQFTHIVKQPWKNIDSNTHSSMVNCLDNHYRTIIINKYTYQDNALGLARIRSLTCNGTLQWLNTPIFQTKYNNQQWNIGLSLILGAPITNQPTCTVCGAIMDPYGYHSLGCTKSGIPARRHNLIRDVLFKVAQEAGYNVAREVRAPNDTTPGVPGDLLIARFDIPDKNDPSYVRVQDTWVDITFVNIFAPSWVPKAAKLALAAAREREKLKIKKYGFNLDKGLYKNDIINNKENFNFLPVAFDVTGATTKRGKILLQRIARQKSLLTGIANSVCMNRLRKHIVSKIMLCNMDAVIKCIN